MGESLFGRHPVADHLPDGGLQRVLCLELLLAGVAGALTVAHLRHALVDQLGRAHLGPHID